MEAVVRQSQSYAQTLQNYNTSLQTDVQVRWLAGMPWPICSHCTIAGSIYYTTGLDSYITVIIRQ
jgi:hypothetical protein